MTAWSYQLPIFEVETHLFIKGINPDYTQWIFHGEEETILYVSDDDIGDDIIQEDDYIDDMQHMLDDIRASILVDVLEDSTLAPNRPPITVDSPAPSFDQLLEDARRPLFDGCTKFSKLSFVVKLLHIKSIGGWSIKSFDMLLDLLRSAFPDALLPQSYEESRSLERGLGFKYHKIHAYPNDCILFWKENAALNECPRLFMSAKIAGDMRWHQEQQTVEATCMRHLADSECLKKFDEHHGWFAADPRNVRLGLEDGVPTYDASTKETFMLHAVLLWTINNFPAYGNLSDWSTKGKLAYLSCNADTDSNWLKYGRKHYYMGHRRFLPPDHIWRRRKGLFNGREDHRMPPRDIGVDDIQNQLQMIGDVQFGKSHRKKKCTAEELNWTKCSIFFMLPYWSTVLLRHDLDVMHNEKNIANNILFTLMNSPEKTKDNINSRRDLEILGYRKELHLSRDGDRVTIPHALYTLHGDEMNKFCEWLSDIKFSDGFASNISNCVSLRDCKISGLKSHDCHVFLQRLLPIAVGGYLRSDIALALTELGTFFKELCARTLDVNRLSQLQTDIVTILCKLEMIFSSSFFDVMVHLAVHLSREAKLGGLVQYRWMYLFEMYLGKFKRYVKNKASPEGSIAEAYIHTECLAFCSMYLKDIETRFRQADRNIDADEEEILDGFSIFNQKVRPLGIASNVQLEDKLFRATIWYVFNNCAEIGPYIEKQGVRVNDHMIRNMTWYKDEPFVLASQADQCFYIRDLRAKGSWGVVQNYTNRNVYSIPPLPSVLEDIDGESSTHDADQENESSYFYEQMQCDNTDQVAIPLNRPDILPSHVDV
ncbi:uncharacterized protein LOC121253386 [Juglans microcarpa x Juglans regia]|uniref:uncharacterized protein LOC121253386 n=1 Tax=Juglans microcarpa x Juglans regia TaxID=2249226 RepID=UPI001B7E3344|nr:uncharacterized protein LOC121253386 [Juglans microcarpa x Juglans regia]